MGKDKTTTTTSNATQHASGQQDFANNSFLESLNRAYQQYGNQSAQTTDQSQSQTQAQTAINNLIASITGQTQQQQAQTQATGVDAGSQAYVDLLRQHAAGAFGGINAGNFAPSLDSINALTTGLSNPFQQGVISNLGANYDRLRDAARTGTSQEATMAGALGGDRHGIAEALRLSELDRSENEQVGGLLAGEFNRAQGAAMPLAAAQAAAPLQAILAQSGLLGGALGPTGSVTTGTGTMTSTQQEQQQQQAQTQSFMDLLSKLTGQQFGNTTGFQQGQTFGSQTGTQSGTASNTMDSTSRSRDTTKESGNLLGQLAGLALTLGPMLFSGGAAAPLLSVGANAAAPVLQSQPGMNMISPDYFLQR
jgi:hypothetical protein